MGFLHKTETSQPVSEYIVYIDEVDHFIYFVFYYIAE